MAQAGASRACSRQAVGSLTRTGVRSSMAAVERSSRVSEPRQARSRESLERVMQAGLDLLADEGWEGFTMAAACRRAGVSMAMMYRRFANRDAFLLALQDRWIAQLEDAQREFLGQHVDWKALDFKAALRLAIDGIVDSIAAEERLLRTWATHEALNDDGLARLARLARRNATWFVTGLMHHRSAITHRDPQQALEFCFRIVLDTSVRRANYGDEFATGTSVGDWRAFADRLEQVVTAFLTQQQRA
jgi:AcrR family transcriptional regulator